MLKCIQAGVGGQGGGWFHFLKGRKDIEVVAIADPSEANRNRAVKEWGVPANAAYASLKDAVRDHKADWVMDVTPPGVHYDVAELAFSNGMHVLGEKPMSDSYAKSKKMVELGTKAGVRHMITQNYRFGAYPRTARRLLKEGLLGSIEQCDMQFYMPWADAPGSHYVTQPYMLINDMMVHHFDMVRYVLGVGDPIAVTSVTWNHSWGWHKGDASHAIVFEFPNNLHFTHVSTGCTIGEHSDWNGNWRIEGTKGSLTYSHSKMNYAHLHRAPEQVRRELTMDPTPDGRAAIVDEFVASIREKRDPECSGKDNLNSVKMVFAAIMSAQQKRRVELAELDK